VGHIRLLSNVDEASVKVDGRGVLYCILVNV